MSMPDKTISLDAPNLGELEKQYLNKAVDSNFVSTVGPFVPQFEAAVADYLDIRHAVATQSGTAALHAALYELGIGPGDEVIVPALTFVASVNPVLYVGATPVFVDVEPATWNISPAGIERAITERTKAILAVHLYGNPCRLDQVMALACQHHLHVIEDATESLGATYQGRQTGTFGDFGVLSFNGNKLITTGGGGMIVGRDEQQMRHLKFLVNQARDESRGYYHPEVGFNYRMTNIEAALGLAQVQKLEAFLTKKREFYAIYQAALQGMQAVRLQESYQDAVSSCWLPGVLFENTWDIPAVQKQLKAKGIPSRRVFCPIVEFPPYSKYKQGEFRNTYHIYERGLCLPGSTLNSEDGIRYVCRVIKDRI